MRVGNSCQDKGESFGVHGRISNTPAEEVCARVDWSDDVPVLTITGRMREARLFGENLVLERNIRFTDHGSRRRGNHYADYGHCIRFFWTNRWNGSIACSPGLSPVQCL